MKQNNRQTVLSVTLSQFMIGNSTSGYNLAPQPPSPPPARPTRWSKLPSKWAQSILLLALFACAQLGWSADWPADSLTPIEIGGPVNGALTPLPDGLRLSSGGSGIAARSDQFYFAQRPIDGDFDLRVQVRSLGNPDLWAKAGLMVRQGLDANSAFAAIFASASGLGCHFQYRSSSDVNTVSTGFFPANSPDLWLRLKRSGDRIAGFAGVDGIRWTLVGSWEISWSGATQVGLASAAKRAGTTLDAEFAKLGDSFNPVEQRVELHREGIGPSSRRTPLAITEIHYHPPDREDGRNLEFVELYNSDFIDLDLSGFRLEGDGIEFVFPPKTTIRAGGFLVVAAKPADVTATYGLQGVLGGWGERSLSNRSGAVRLKNPSNAVLLEAIFDSEGDWPVAADGLGHSLVLARPSYGERDVRAWAASQRIGGSPGAIDPVWAPDPMEGLWINELHVGGSNGNASFLELYNPTPSPIEFYGAIRYTAGRLLPATTRTVPAGSRLSIPLPGLEFNDRVAVLSRDGSRVAAAVRALAHGPQESWGRSPESNSDWRLLSARTSARANAAAVPPSVIISELFYHPVSEDDDEQFIELFNRGPASVALDGWKFTEGVDFEFPAGRVLPKGEYLVVARNRDRFLALRPGFDASRVVGNFSGRLSRQGERLVLKRADGVIAHELHYGTGGEWPHWADGGGSSLELIDTEADPQRPGNWADSDESQKAPWTEIDVSGRLAYGQGAVDTLHVLLQGAGECLLDDIEFFGRAGTNLITNPQFTAGAAGWTPQGNHESSAWAEGLDGKGGGALRIRATGRGDNGANRVRTSVRSGTISEGDLGRIRARVRWIRGHPELLLRVKGNYFEAIAQMKVPGNLGTPGAPNSRRVDHAPPSITGVQHFPVLPAANESVQVRAQVDSASGINAVRLVYRVDPATETTTVDMRDDGLSGDGTAGDGLYGAMIPGQDARKLVAFRVEAEDRSGRPSVFPAGAPAREALVRFGEAQPTGSIGAYRIWITDATSRRWSARNKLHNGELDCTFVYGDQRAIYNAGTLYSGSPFVSPGYTGPTGALCGYVLHMPEDQPFLGAQDLVLDWPIRDTNLQLEQVAYWLGAQMGLPYNNRRFIHLFVNGNRRGTIYEDTQQPNSDHVDQWFPDDSNGDLFKIEDWFEFDLGGGSFEFNSDANLMTRETDTGEKHLASYRWNFRKRAVRGSANDYQSLFDLVDAFNSDSQIDFDALDRLVDIDEWMGVFALEHIAGNWDSFGYSRGKNMFAYKPERGRWQLLPWDIDFVFSSGGSGPGNSMFDTIEPNISQMYSHPPYRRKFFRKVEKAVAALDPQIVNRILDSRYEGFILSGVNAGRPTTAKTWLQNQRNALQQLLSNSTAPFQVLDARDNTLTVSDTLVVLNGTAPLAVDSFLYNGEKVPVEWVSDTNWRLPISLQKVPPTFEIVGLDSSGQVIPNAKVSLKIVFNGVAELASEKIVFSEIYSQPATPGAEFIEIRNESERNSFDLSRWTLPTLNFRFPSGALLRPQSSYLLLRNTSAFVAENGAILGPFATFNKPLPATDGRLELFRTDSAGNPVERITGVVYGRPGVWPQPKPGQSYQLWDASRGQDERAGNWTVHEPAPPPKAEWKLVESTATAQGTNLIFYVSSFPVATSPTDIGGAWEGRFNDFPDRYRLEFWRDPNNVLQGTIQFLGFQTPPETLSNVTYLGGVLNFTWPSVNVRYRGRLDAVARRVAGSFTFGGNSVFFALQGSLPPGVAHIDDVQLTEIDAANQTPNLVANGDFEAAPTLVQWTATGTHSGSGIDEKITHGGIRSLRLAAVNSSSAGGLSSAVYQSVPVTPGKTYKLSFRCFGIDAEGLGVQLGDDGIFAAVDLRRPAPPKTTITPWQSNPKRARDIGPLPELWLNEVAGGPNPWIELFSREPSELTLSNYYIGDASTGGITPTDPSKLWPLSPTLRIPQGGFAQVAIGPSQGLPLSNSGGALILWKKLDSGEFVQIDHILYPPHLAEQSFGHAPDGTPFDDQRLRSPSPAASNTSAVTPELPRVRINEWMASNTGAVRDPADPSTATDFDDWFELYNPTGLDIDLAGWSLTDREDTPRQFVIPTGYRIPARGYLLVWADDETAQNAVNNGQLHVNFRLSAGGETIAIYNPEGALIDSVKFDAQEANRSEGRTPDGAAAPWVRWTDPTPGRANPGSIVVPPPNLTALEWLNAGRIRLKWTSTPGVQYRLRSRSTLDSGAWTDRVSLKAAGPETAAELPTDGARAEFFQVIADAP